MQDSQPSHWVKATQEFLWNIVPDFINAEEWAPHSPDLNDLDYSVWDILQEVVCEGWRQPYANLRELEKAIRQQWNEIKDQTIKYKEVEKASSSSNKTGWRPV